MRCALCVFRQSNEPLHHADYEFAEPEVTGTQSELAIITEDAGIKNTTLVICDILPVVHIIKLVLISNISRSWSSERPLI